MSLLPSLPWSGPADVIFFYEPLQEKWEILHDDKIFF